MQRLGLTYFIAAFTLFCSAQQFNPKDITPDSSTFENVYVKKVKSDTFQSTFLIWVKNKVPPHYHENHTEYIHVISGSGFMTLADSTFKIKKGDAVLIPATIIHSVETISKKPLKVVSVQAPKFDGDRIWVQKK